MRCCDYDLTSKCSSNSGKQTSRLLDGLCEAMPCYMPTNSSWNSCPVLSRHALAGQCVFTSTAIVGDKDRVEICPQLRCSHERPPVNQKQQHRQTFNCRARLSSKLTALRRIYASFISTAPTSVQLYYETLCSQLLARWRASVETCIQRQQQN